MNQSSLIRCLFVVLGLSATTTHGQMRDIKSAEAGGAFVRNVAVKEADQKDIKCSLVWLDENKANSLLKTKEVDKFLQDTKYLNYAVGTASFVALLSIACIWGMLDSKKNEGSKNNHRSNNSYCNDSCWYTPWHWNYWGNCHYCHCYNCCCSSSISNTDFNTMTLDNISDKIMPVLVSLENKSQKDILLPTGSYLGGLHTFAFNPKDVLKKYPDFSSKKCSLWFTYIISMLLALGTGGITIYGATQLFNCLFCSGYFFGSLSLLAEALGSFATYCLFKLGFQHGKYFEDLNSLKKHFGQFEDSMTVVRKDNVAEPVQRSGKFYIVHPGQTFEEILLINSTELTKMQTLFPGFNKDNMDINLLYNY